MPTDPLDSDTSAGVIDALDAARQRTGLSAYRVFSDFLTFTVASFSGDEETYQHHVERYRRNYDEETVRAVMHDHSEALAELTLAMEDSEHDVIGGVYEQYGLSSDNFGQHFTPEPVGDMIAALDEPSEEELREATPEDPLVIGDMAGCGSGRLLLNTARRIRSREPSAPAVYVGHDIDADCAKMCVINFVLRSVEGYVLLGDALKCEATRIWSVSPKALLTGSRPARELSEPEREELLADFFGEAAGTDADPDSELPVDADVEADA